MDEKNNHLNFTRIMVIAGSFIAFAIGSGFSTGQEIMQFFAVFGDAAFAAVVFFFIGNLYINYNFLEAGRIGQFDKGSQVFYYFCGKYIGAFFDWFAVIFTYMSYFVMISGAGATLNQQFGIPNVAGAIIIAALAGITIMFGLNKLVDIIGRIGPAIILFCIIGGIAGIANGDLTLAEASAKLPEMGVIAAADNWFLSMVSYIGFGMMWFAPFLSQIGKNEKVAKNAQIGVAGGIATLCIAIVIITIGLLKNIGLVASSQIPLLMIVNESSPVLSFIFSIIIFLGIYTTACPLLWTPCNRIAEEGTMTYKILAAVLAAVGCVIGLLVPYAKIVNFIYAVNGKVGFILVAFILYKNITSFVKRDKKAEA